MLNSEEISHLIDSDYDTFVEFLLVELVEISNKNGIIDDLLNSSSGQIKSDINDALSRIRDRKIDEIINEE